MVEMTHKYQEVAQFWKWETVKSYIVFEHGNTYNILGQLILLGIENEKQFIKKNKKQAIRSETMIQTHENPAS